MPGPLPGVPGRTTSETTPANAPLSSREQIPLPADNIGRRHPAHFSWGRQAVGMEPPPRSESPSGTGGTKRRVVIDRIAYDVDFESFEVLCNNVYLDAVAARRIIHMKDGAIERIESAASGREAHSP